MIQVINTKQKSSSDKFSSDFGTLVFSFSATRITEQYLVVIVTMFFSFKYWLVSASL